MRIALKSIVIVHMIQCISILDYAKASENGRCRDVIEEAPIGRVFQVEAAENAHVGPNGIRELFRVFSGGYTGHSYEYILIRPTLYPSEGNIDFVFFDKHGRGITFPACATQSAEQFSVTMRHSMTGEFGKVRTQHTASFTLSSQGLIAQVHTMRTKKAAFLWRKNEQSAFTVMLVAAVLPDTLVRRALLLDTRMIETR